MSGSRSGGVGRVNYRKNLLKPLAAHRVITAFVRVRAAWKTVANNLNPGRVERSEREVRGAVLPVGCRSILGGTEAGTLVVRVWVGFE